MEVGVDFKDILDLFYRDDNVYGFTNRANLYDPRYWFTNTNYIKFKNSPLQNETSLFIEPQPYIHLNYIWIFYFIAMILIFIFMGFLHSRYLMGFKNT